jgi:hypothetical protein
MLIRFAHARTWPRAPEGAGGGGGDGMAGAGDGAAGDGAANGGDDGNDGGLFDAAAGANPPKTEDGKPGRPDWVTEQFWDAEKGEVRVQDLAKSQRDLRAQIARGDHKPPEKADAYTIPTVEGLPAGAIGGEGDTLWPELRTAAHASGISQKQLDALAAPFLR